MILSAACLSVVGAVAVRPVAVVQSGGTSPSAAGYSAVEEVVPVPESLVSAIDQQHEKENRALVGVYYNPTKDRVMLFFRKESREGEVPPKKSK